MAPRFVRLISAVGLAAALLPIGIVGAQARDTVTFRIGVREAPQNVDLNPFRSGTIAATYIRNDIFDFAINKDENLEPAPGLVESWQQSSDGLTWTYKVRTNATWSDGQPVTADDIVFMYYYYRDSNDPAYTGPLAPNGNDTDGDGAPDHPISCLDGCELLADTIDGLANSRIVKVEAPDATTVVYTTSEPMGNPLFVPLPVIPKHIWQNVTWEQATGDYTYYDQASGLPVGSGPFVLKEFDPESATRVEANVNHWAGAPKIDEIVYQYFSNDEAMVQALRTGQIDMIGIVPQAQVSVLQSDASVTVMENPGSAFHELGFNAWNPTPEEFASQGCADCPKGPTTGSMGNPWMTKPEVRAALSGLIDRQSLVERAASSHATAGVSLVGPSNPKFHWAPPADDPVSFPAYTDEAGRTAAREAANDRFKTAMAALGFSDTDGDGILNVPDTAATQAFDPVHTVRFSDTGDTNVGAGLNFKLRLLTRDSSQEENVAAELIEAWFEEAGVDVDRQIVKEDQLFTATVPVASNVDMDMYIWMWHPGVHLTAMPFVFTTCGQINNLSDVSYCNTSYDGLYRQYLRASTEEEKIRTAKEMQEIIYHDAVYSIFWYDNEVSAYRSDRWDGLKLWPASGGTIWYEGSVFSSRMTVAPKGAAAPSESLAPGESPTAAPSATAAPTTGADNTALIVGGGLVLIVVVVGGAYLLMRRRSAEED